MIATLYLPQQPEKKIFIDELRIPDHSTRLVNVSAQVSALLGCSPELVDVLASGPGYVAYSIFNYEDGLANEPAMHVLSYLTGISFELDDEDTVLLGPVLVVSS